MILRKKSKNYLKEREEDKDRMEVKEEKETLNPFDYQFFFGILIFYFLFRYCEWK